VHLPIEGIDAYYPLAKHPSPSLNELKEGWKNWIDIFTQLNAKWGKKLIFTEIGTHLLSIDHGYKVQHVGNKQHVGNNFFSQ
jgi:hypothetical protein